MSEQEPLDRLLRDSMSRDAVPVLSHRFDRQLDKRLRPRRLSRSGRLTLIAYTAGALVLSIVVMRAESVGWVQLALAVLLPLLGAAVWSAPLRRSTPG